MTDDGEISRGIRWKKRSMGFPRKPSAVGDDSGEICISQPIKNEAGDNH